MGTAESLGFHLQPTLVGTSITLRPLRAEDLEPLYDAASDPLIWEQHPDPHRHEREAFALRYFAGALASGGALVVTDNSTNQVIGSSRYYEWDAHTQEVAIGYTFLRRSHWGGATNREMKRLMLAHAFRWAGVVWFHVGAANWRSRKAVEKIGGGFSHQTMRDVNGIRHEYAYYKIERRHYAPDP